MGRVDFSKFIENRIKNIQASDNFAFATAIGVGPWLVPLGPAIIFGYALYKSAPSDMAEFRIVTAVAVGIALIVAGAVSSHTAIVSGGLRPWSLVIGYIVLEIAGLWLMSVTFDVKIVGTVASLLTLIVYLSRSSAKEIDLTKAKVEAVNQTKFDFQIEQARLNAEHQRTMAQRAAELKHEEELAQIEQVRLNAEHQKAMGQHNTDLKHAEKLARIEAKAVRQVSVPPVSQQVSQGVSQIKSLETLKPDILAELGQETPNLTQLASRLDIGRSTLYRHLGTLEKQGEVIKNGDGYKPV